MWEHIKALLHAHEESLILKSIKHIQASIPGLEQKYENIEAQIKGNNAEMIANKLNGIQATTTRPENKYEAIENTVKETPKTYANITKTTITNMNRKAIAETCIQQRQHRDVLR
jgi:hypothetical protein